MQEWMGAAEEVLFLGGEFWRLGRGWCGGGGELEKAETGLGDLFLGRPEPGEVGVGLLAFAEHGEAVLQCGEFPVVLSGGAGLRVQVGGIGIHGVSRPSARFLRGKDAAGGAAPLEELDGGGWTRGDG